MPALRKYVVNPKTGRRVLADGPTGKKILKARRARRARASSNVRSCVASCTRKCLARKRGYQPRASPRRKRIRDDYVSVSDVYGSDSEDFANDYVSVSDVYS